MKARCCKSRAEPTSPRRTVCARASRGISCSIVRRFTPNPAVRSATAACCVQGPRYFASKIPRGPDRHLKHKALHDVLGAHVQQKGSLVDDRHTRFDFSHFAPMTPEQIAEVERRVNEQILHNDDTRVRVMDVDSARAEGAMALFGEKYGSEGRGLNIGDSIELCGGTHVRWTGDIGLV